MPCYKALRFWSEGEFFRSLQGPKIQYGLQLARLKPRPFQNSELFSIG